MSPNHESYETYMRLEARIHCLMRRMHTLLRAQQALEGIDGSEQLTRVFRLKLEGDEFGFVSYMLKKSSQHAPLETIAALYALEREVQCESSWDRNMNWNGAPVFGDAQEASNA